jgi:hypothetical protein
MNDYRFIRKHHAFINQFRTTFSWWTVTLFDQIQAWFLKCIRIILLGKSNWNDSSKGEKEVYFERIFSDAAHSSIHFPCLVPICRYKADAINWNLSWWNLVWKQSIDLLCSCFCILEDWIWESPDNLLRIRMTVN